LISAAKTTKEVAEISDIAPVNEGQAKQLRGLPPSVAAKVMAKAAASGKITAASIAEARRQITRSPTREPTAGIFVTPAVIVNAAREAMGGIDLDPASDLRANDVHKIGMYYDRERSAFENPWFGRVWLNPPFGDWAPWFEQIIRYWDAGEMTQLCMLSPAYAFTTRLAQPVMERAAAMILLSPTPKFSGNPQGGNGTNLPHMIMYVGPRVNDFATAFEPFGFPFIARRSVEV
jgi:hypothetical protein